MFRSLRLRTIAAMMGGALALTGCVGGSTPYQPFSSANRIQGGYSDAQIAEGLHRVSFAGNQLTSREQVESYLLFRSAELSLEKGYDWFAIEDRVIEHDVERQIRRDPLYDPWYDSRFGYWRPSWRYYGARGWRSWYPYHGHTFWTDHVDVREVERFEAIAEIRMGNNPPPSGASRSMNAREVIERLGPRVVRPDSD